MSTSKTINVRLLVATLAVVAILAPALWWWHARQLRHLRGSLLTRAEQLEREGEWGEAGLYLQRYLQLDPGNVAISVRLARTFDRVAVSAPLKKRAVGFFYRAIGLEPEDASLRSRLAQLLFEQGMYAAARQEAEAALKLDPQSAQGREVRALALYGLSHFGLADPEMAFADIRAAAESQPANPRLADTLALIYREEWKSLDSAERIRLADQVMDRLIAADPQCAQSYLARHRYRLKYSLPGADSDIAEASRRAPNDDDVLAARAESAYRSAHYADAIKLYEQLLRRHPRLSPAFLGRGDCEAALGRPDKALEVWRRGLKMDPDNPALHFRAAEVLLQKGEHKQVRSHLSALDASVARFAASSAASDRAVVSSLRPAIQLLRARWLLATGDYSAADELMRRVAEDAPSQSAIGIDSPSLQSWLLLGDSCRRRRMWDQAAAAFEKAVALSPSNPTARLGAANAWSRLGQFQPAMAHYRALLAAPNPPRQAHIDLVRMLWELQASSAAGGPDPAELNQALAQADKAAPGAWEIALIKAEILRAGASPESQGKALSELASIERQSPDDPSAWQQLAMRYLKWGQRADAERALAGYEQRVKDPVRRGVVRAQWHAELSEWEHVEKSLTDAYRACDSTRSSEIAFLVSDWYRGRNRMKEAKEVLLAQLDQFGPDLVTLCGLTEIAIQSADYATAQTREAELKSLEGPEGSHWKLYRAQRLVAQARDESSSEMREARLLVTQLETERPSWSQLALLKAKVAERWGDVNGASEAYETAIRQGEREPAIVGQLVRLLYQQQRYADAEAVLTELMQTGRFTPELAGLEVVAAAGQGQLDRAIRIAREVVERQSKDALAHVSLGQVLLLAGKTAESEAEFRSATALAPQDVNTWAALFFSLLRVGNQKAAAETLGQVAAATKLPPADRAFLLAQGHQALGNAAEAERYYVESEKLAPTSVAVKVQRALFVVNRDPTLAERLLREALQREPQSAEVRGLLVELLAARDTDAAWEDATALLNQSASGLSESQTKRMRAGLLASRGRPEDLAESRRILESLRDTPAEMRPADRALLARIYTRDGLDQDAMREFLAAVERPTPRPVDVAALVEFLVERKRLDEAKTWLDRLSAAAPDAWETCRLRARWLHVRGSSQDAVLEVERFVEQRLTELTDQPNERQRWMRDASSLFVLIELPQAAERWLRRLAADVPQGYPELADFLATHGGLAEAVQLCRDEAVRDASALPVDTLVRVLLAAEPNTAQEAASESLLASVAEKFPNDGRLLFSLGNLRLRQERVDEAIRLFRRAAEREPKNYFAWNNLASILGERPADREEAMRCIDRGIAEAGRRVPLLVDTKATLLMHEGRYQEAAALLEEVRRSGDQDPRYLFHLALAYEKLGSREGSRRALQAAQQQGLGKTYLSRLEQDQLAALDRALKR